MDDDLKKSCPSCSQLYFLQLTSSKVKGNLPLFLPCGHTMCENCIVNIMKCLEPIECKVCFRDADVKITDPNELIQNKLKLYQNFPVNVQMVGELTMNLMKAPDAAQKKAEDETFIDLKTLIKSDAAQGNCLECNATTTKMCKECVTILCDACFNKTHKNFVIFKNHVLQSIESNMRPSTCKLHIGKPLDYYCNDCKKSVCTDCMMLGGEKFCKNHDVVSLQEVNETFLEDLTEISPQVDETFRRLTKTAVDIGYLLYNYESDTGSVKELSKIIASVEQHFSKLFSIIQKHKDEIINIILYLKFSEKNSLQKARSEVANSIKKAKNVLNVITIATETKNIKQINLPALLEEAKLVTNTPWFLNRTETNKESLKVTVNEDLCSLISDYVHLEGNVKSVYKLFSTSELGDDVEIPPAPNTLVYPPELPKDARYSKPKKEKEKHPALYKNAPKYHSKSGSVSSLNSNCSEKSTRSYITQNNYQQQPVVQPVSPFLENQHPQPLIEGTQELIYISHIVNPHNFFVQRACFQGLVKDMLREFRNAISFAKPSLNHITPGKIYLAFNKADNMWQRCRVLSVDTTKNDPIIQVFCLDFGSIEFVPVERLRLLPPSKIQCPFPLALNCSLFNCVPKMGDWTSEDSFLIQNIIDNKQAVIHIRRMIPISNVEFKLECDVTTFEHGISLAHALVFHDRAKMPNPRAPYPAIKGVKEKLKLYTSHNDTYGHEKNPELVSIIHVVSPDKFYVRKQHLQKVYEKLSEDLEQEYSLASNVGTVHLPEIGMVCAVNLENCRSVALDATWARGVVTELPGRSRVRVTLPDVGLVVLVHWAALRYIHPKFTTISALATECHLAGITPYNNKWSAASVELLQKYCGISLELQVEDNRNRSHHSQGSIGVTLFYKPDNDNVVCINSEMIKHKFAISFGVYMFSKSPVEEQVLTNKSPLEKPKPSAPSKPKQTILKRNEKMPEKVNEDDLQAKDKGPLRLEVKILNCQSPSLIYVSLVHQQQSFKDLFEKMQKKYSKNNKNKSKEDWQVGDRCVTLCIQSQTWRRAVIMELGNDNAKVFYSDFACIETVPKSTLIELTSEFSMFGDAAIKCHLCGIMPAVGEEWPTITKDCLKDLIDEYKRFFITKLGNFKDKSMPIQLWVYHTEQGGALEPNQSSWRCLNDKIVERGLCVPDKSQVVKTEDNTEDTGDTLSFLNITGSVNEWLQLEPMPMAPLNAGKADEDLNTNSPSSFLEDEDNNPLPGEGQKSSNITYITDWLPPEPLPCTEFTARPTYIDNDGLIFLHDVSQQDTLDLIREALDVGFTGPDPKAKFNKWTVGEPCIALFYLDNRFYRGRVVEVNKDTSSCLIHYIDYGCEETCTFENLRKSIRFHQVPTQAHKCILNRIRPLGKQWARNTLDYLHKAIVEKQCYVKVTGEPVNGVTPIDLKYDKIWINDHLVEFSMAEYTDGSKALVTKYAPIEKINRDKIKDDIIESDSGPDYIVVDDADTTTEQLSTSQDSSDIISLKGADWNTLMEEEQLSLDGNYITYPRNTDDEFCCNITIINDFNTLELSLVLDEDSTTVYDQMFEELQTESMNMPPLRGVFENKACVAIFPEDNLWYRASILQFSEKTNQVKVRYVDYGNMNVIPLADTREICEEWARLPPATVTAKLFGVRLNPEIDISNVKKEYTELFLDQGPFNVKVISHDDSVPLVEIRNKENELVYKKLIENNMFIQCE